jgi:hypothetical protein
MTISVCQTNVGILGRIIVSPEITTIPRNVNVSNDIDVTIQASAQQQEEATVVVSIKDIFSNNIDGIDFQFSDFDILTFSIEKDIENNSFSYTIQNPSSPLNNLKFKIVKTNKFIADTEAIITFNAISSGYGASSSELNILADSSDIAVTETGENITQDGFAIGTDVLIFTTGQAALESTAESQTQVENIFSPKINSQYNFYISKYENLISESSIPENALPNINYLYTEANIANFSLNKARTLNGLLNQKIILNTSNAVSVPNISSNINANLTIKETPSNQKIILNRNNSRFAQIKDFFEEFTLDVSKETKQNNNYLSTYQQQFHNLFSNNYSRKLLLDVENKKQNFPMSVSFEILLENNKIQLNTFLKKLNILDYFCYCLVNEFRNPSNININKEQFFNKYFSNKSTILDINLSNFIYLGDISNISSFNDHAETNFLKSISSAILKSKYGDFFTGIYSGAEQVVMYEVHKKFGDTTISKNYFINDFETQFLKFYDTQVKYDKEYTYEVNKIVCLNATITKINILSKSLKVFDLPPIAPQVDYVGYRGQDNKILITLNSSTGKVETQPEIILEEDKEKFEKNITQQERTDNKIKFASDDIPAEFELMRLDTEPYSYKDFSNGKIINLSNKIDGVVKFTANSFVDDIQPNKKYYYITRSKDVHDNISNPTAPIEIQMINENGTIYLIKKEYTFKNIPKKPTKEFKKYIEIKVAENQASINPQTFNNNSQTAQNLQVYLGNAEKSVWEKQFLLRVTSKTTGKKVDVKFKFNYMQPPIPQTT